MLWAGAKPIDVYLGTRGFAVCAGAEIVVSRHTSSFDEGLAGLGAYLSEAGARPRIRMWLSGGLCRPFVLSPIQGVKTESELMQVATGLAPEWTGLVPPCTVWLDRAALNTPRVGVAVESARLDRVLTAVHTKPRALGKLISIRPWWSDVLRSALAIRPEAVVVAIQDCDSLTVVLGSSKAISVARTLSPVMDRNAADGGLARTLLSSDISEPAATTIVRLRTDVPSGAAPAITAGWSGLSLSSLAEISA